jgi:DNA-binding response OmpR family regulator
MPYKDGFTLAKEIREVNELVPIFFLSAKHLKEDLLKGFRLGADDYLTKPFDSDVLLAKIKAILNRSSSAAIPSNDTFEFTFSDFYFNSKLRFLTFKSQKSIKLSPKENQLLRLLVIYINDLLPREIALSKIWRDDNYFTSRSMDVYIAKLRKYLSVDEKVQILNIHGEGFRLVIT